MTLFVRELQVNVSALTLIVSATYAHSASGCVLTGICQCAKNVCLAELQIEHKREPNQ